MFKIINASILVLIKWTHLAPYKLNISYIKIKIATLYNFIENMIPPTKKITFKKLLKSNLNPET